MRPIAWTAALTLLFSLAAASCGGSTGPLTVDEYVGWWCSERVEADSRDFGDLLIEWHTWGDFKDFTERDTDTWRSVTPPEGLSEYHGMMIQSRQILDALAGKQDQGESFSIVTMRFEVGDSVSEIVGEARSGLAPDLRDRLDLDRCLAEG